MPSTTFQDQIKKLKGVVKVSDVQANIDILINGINTLIDKINFANNQTTTVDPTVGARKISGPQYTLTCYALHHLLDHYKSNLLCGCRAVNMNNNLILFPGLFVNADATGCKQIPSQKITTFTGDTTSLYYNISNDEVTFTYNEGTTTLIGELDWKRESNVLNTLSDGVFINPNNSPKINMVKNNFGYADTIPLPSNASAFLLPFNKYLPDNQWTSVAIDGKEICRKQTGGQNKRAITIFNYCPIFVPKGLNGKVSNSSSTDGGNAQCKSLQFTIDQ